METDLIGLRKNIDKIDEQIIKLFGDRFKITERVGIYKRDNNLKSKDPIREQEQIKQIQTWAQMYHVDADFIEKIFHLTVEVVIQNHNKISQRK